MLEFLSQSSLSNLLLQAKHNVSYLLDFMENYETIQYQSLLQSNGISIYRSLTKSTFPFHGECSFHGNLQTTMKHYIQTMTNLKEYETYMHHLYENFSYCHTLQMIVSPSIEYPYRSISLKAIVFKYGKKEKMYIYLDYIDFMQIDTTEKEEVMIGFQLYESISKDILYEIYELTSLPEIEEIGCHGYIWQNAYELNNDIHMVAMMHETGFMKSSTLMNIQQSIKTQFDKFLSYYHYTMIVCDEFIFERDQQVIPHHENYNEHQCYLCQRNFHILKKKYYCLKCGQVICTKCASLQNAVIPKIGQRRVRICIKCILVVRRHSSLLSVTGKSSMNASFTSKEKVVREENEDNVIENFMLQIHAATTNNASLLQTQQKTEYQRKNTEEESTRTFQMEGLSITEISTTDAPSDKKPKASSFIAANNDPTSAIRETERIMKDTQKLYHYDEIIDQQSSSTSTVLNGDLSEAILKSRDLIGMAEKTNTMAHQACDEYAKLQQSNNNETEEIEEKKQWNIGFHSLPNFHLKGMLENEFDENEVVFEFNPTSVRTDNERKIMEGLVLFDETCLEKVETNKQPSPSKEQPIPPSRRPGGRHTVCAMFHTLENQNNENQMEDRYIPRRRQPIDLPIEVGPFLTEEDDADYANELLFTDEEEVETNYPPSCLSSPPARVDIPCLKERKNSFNIPRPSEHYREKLEKSFFKSTQPKPPIVQPPRKPRTRGETYEEYGPACCLASIF